MRPLSEPSCSDCKLELIEKRWTQLLLKWINRCISTRKVKRLNPKSLADIMEKYNKDVCVNDIDRAILCTDDMEPFIKYKYPILRLQFVSEESDAPERLYITTTMILYHCCISSRTGAVDEDICKEMTKYEQELILKFCENLCDMEATVNNVEKAIRDAFDSIGLMDDFESQSDQFDSSLTSDTEARASSESTTKDSMTTLPSDDTIVPDVVKQPTLKFNSSITVLPSVMADTSTYSDLVTDSEDMTEKEVYVDSEEFNVYAMENANAPVTDKQDVSKELHEVNKRDGEAPENTEAENDVKENADIEHTSRNGARENASKRHTVKESAKEYAMSKHQVYGKELHQKNQIDTLTSNPNNILADSSEIKKLPCLDNCTCKKCNAAEPGCGDVGSTMGVCEPEEEKKKQFLSFLSGLNMTKNMKMYLIAVAVLLFIIIVVVCSTVPFLGSKKEGKRKAKLVKLANTRPLEGHVWHCKNGLCHKVYQPVEHMFESYSRCSLICMGPQLWPYPIGYTFYSKSIVALSTSKLEYKFQSIPSDAVQQYLAEAFKLFIGHLARLEKSAESRENDTIDLTIKKMSIQIDVESDPEPRLKTNTEEAYHLKIDTVKKKVVIQISSSSFCGVRHGLETLSQMILQDQKTGKLITLSNAVVKDAPNYKYRGLMIDTARNYIPVSDLMRTLDGMASVKLNTFHWRISDVTSFPLLLPSLPQLFEYGAYDRSLVYTKEDVKAVVNRAGYRGIRVLIEVAAPGPVGRPWSWSPDVSCPTKTENFTCDNTLCLRMNMKDSIFDILRIIYSEILDLTKVDDIIHLSDGIFSLTNCFYLIEDREGFLDKILAILQQANKGFLPKLPVVWYTPHLMKDYDAKTWDRLGVQLNEINQNTNDDYLSKFKVIHSSKWDLSCEMKKYRCRKYRTWQEMYTWKSWRNIEVFTIEGGEAVLWTDLVSSANLDFHLWPRAVAVAERLWSDAVVNASVGGPVYVRLDSQRWRMLFHGINVQPVWPVWCSFNPGVCLEKLKSL